LSAAYSGQRVFGDQIPKSGGGPEREEYFGYATQMQKSALLETIGMNLVLGLTNPMIDNWGHIGGFVGGVAMSYLIGPKLYVEVWWFVQMTFIRTE
jgi:hypothetical protein